MFLPAESCVFNLLGGEDPLWRHSMLDRFVLVQMSDRNTVRLQVERWHLSDAPGTHRPEQEQVKVKVAPGLN
jgi:hypothetical protein